MITQERLAGYKRAALKSVEHCVVNPAAPGMACVSVSPHDLLDLILHYEETALEQKDEAAQQ